MKQIIYISTLISFLLASCKQPGNEIPVSPETPAALQENKGSADIGFSKKRYEDDLIESLYAELVEKTTALKELEKAIDGLNDQKFDSIQPFHKFDSKNISYYHAARQHLGKISDSMLVIRIKTMIDNSAGHYNKKVARHKSLISLINSRDMTLKDLHVVLKIVKTLPLIEKYQVENLPSDKPMEKVIHNFDRTIRRADTLTKQ